jgi:hypothetical protein
VPFKSVTLMKDPKSATQDSPAEIVLDTRGMYPQDFRKAYSHSLNAVLMLVFSNAQMELDVADMKAIRDVMDLSIQLQSGQEEQP